MNLEGLSRARNAACAALLMLCASTVVLAGVLVVRASRPREIVVVPGVQEEAVLVPGRVPEGAARAFAMLYVARFDNYTPSVVQEVSAHLQALVAAGYWHHAAEALEKRGRISVEGRMSSQVILPRPEETTVEGERELVVVVPAFRRTFIGGHLAREGRVRYRLLLEPCVPGPGNPYGLLVAGQEIQEVEDEGR